MTGSTDSNYSKSEKEAKINGNGLPKRATCECTANDLKLREAEKTIANKDIIIKMLQSQVKKLQESYKQNVKQTEDFRYKYCLASERIKQLRSCPNNKSKEKQQKFNEELKCDPGCIVPECIPLDANVCTLKFMETHYKVLQALVDEILRKRYNLTASEDQLCEKQCEKQDEKRTSFTNSSACLQKITELQDEINKLKSESSKLNEKMNEVETASTSSVNKNNGNNNSAFVKNRNSSDYSKMNELMWVTTEEGSSSKCIVKPSSGNTIPPSHQELEDPSSIQHTEEVIQGIHADVRGNSFSERESIKDEKIEANDNIQECDECEMVDQCNQTQEEKNYILCRAGSIVHAADTDSLTFHRKHVSGSKMSHEGLEDVPMIKSILSHSTIPVKNDLSKPAVSFHGIPWKIPDDQQQDENLISAAENEQDEVEVVTVRQPENDAKYNEPNRDDLQEIKEKIMMLVEKQEISCKELEEVKKQMCNTCKCTETCNEEILNLKQTLTTSIQQNKVITDNLAEANNKLSEELNEVKDKVEILFKIVNELKDHRQTVCGNPEGDQHKEHTECLDDSDVTVARVQYQIPEKEREDSSVTIKGSVDVNTDLPKDIHVLEGKYSELKKQQLEKDQQIESLNDLISYYCKLNNEVLCLCPTSKDDNHRNKTIEFQDKNITACPCNEDTHNEENIIRKKEVKVIASTTETRKIADNDDKYECPFPCGELVDQREFVQTCESEELQIEDIYNAVLKCTNKTKPSCSFAPRSVKSIMCFCNVNLDKYVSTDKMDKKISIEEIYEAVRCSCKEKKEALAEDADKKYECNSSSVSSSSCLLNYDNLVCDKSLQPNLEAYVHYLHEQLQVISTIEQRIELLRDDMKAS